MAATVNQTALLRGATSDLSEIQKNLLDEKMTARSFDQHGKKGVVFEANPAQPKLHDSVDAERMKKRSPKRRQEGNNTVSLVKARQIGSDFQMPRIEGGPAQSGRFDVKSKRTKDDHPQGGFMELHTTTNPVLVNDMRSQQHTIVDDETEICNVQHKLSLKCAAIRCPDPDIDEPLTMLNAEQHSPLEPRFDRSLHYRRVSSEDLGELHPKQGEAHHGEQRVLFDSGRRGAREMVRSKPASLPTIHSQSQDFSLSKAAVVLKPDNSQQKGSKKSPTLSDMECVGYK